jgi:hypothetical protein
VNNKVKKTSEALPMVLAVWMAGVSVVCGTLLTRHAAPLPVPAHVASGFSALTTKSDRLVVFHVLVASCRCSQNIARSLVTSARPAGIEEHVLLVDDTDQKMEKQLSLAGRNEFRIHHVTAKELESRFDVAGVPLLLVVGQDGAIRYSGGYTERKQGLVLRDRSIIDAIARGETPEPLPLYGCAVAEDIRNKRNPWWLP